jgi:hypothetical protein
VAANPHAGLPTPDDREAFTAAILPWVDRGAAFAHMVVLLGDTSLTPMAVRLCDELAEFHAAATFDGFEAHKFGGFAGMLGFRRLAHCAERLARGDESYRAAALREAGWALQTMRAYLRNAPSPKTLV